MSGLTELSQSYAASGRACRERARALRRQLREQKQMCEVDRLRLRRRIQILLTMANDCSATARYLARYYHKAETEKEKQVCNKHKEN